MKLLIVINFFFLFSSMSIQRTSQLIVKENKKITIIDLSKVVEFHFQTQEMKILKKGFLKNLIEELKNQGVRSEIIFQIKHEDRLYLDSKMSNSERLKNYFVERGIQKRKISSMLGFDFGKNYSIEYENSSIILLIKSPAKQWKTYQFQKKQKN